MRYHNIPREFSEENYGRLVDMLNTFMREVSIQNMGGRVIKDVTLPSGVDIRVPHDLKVTPKYFIVLRKSQGDANIGDGQSDKWNEHYVVLRNYGPSAITATILLMKE